MLAVVKTPRTEIKIRGIIPVLVLDALKKEYGKKLHLKPEESAEELIDIFETKEYKNFKKNIKPGDYVRVYRENTGLTQEALGEKMGLSRAYVCDIEKGRRSISKVLAKAFAELFQIPVSRFI